MPHWKLTPDPARLDDPRWKASQHRGVCYAAAPTESQARAAAQERYGVAVDREPDGSILADPWFFPELASCDQVGVFGKYEMSSGEVWTREDMIRAP